MSAIWTSRRVVTSRASGTSGNSPALAVDFPFPRVRGSTFAVLEHRHGKIGSHAA
jgi:hypothetical protein